MKLLISKFWPLQFCQPSHHFYHILLFAMVHIGIEHQFLDKTEGKQRRRRDKVKIMSRDVSQGFLIVWFRRTQYIPQFGGVLQEVGFYLEGSDLLD